MELKPMCVCVRAWWVHVRVCAWWVHEGEPGRRPPHTHTHTPYSQTHAWDIHGGPGNWPPPHRHITTYKARMEHTGWTRSLAAPRRHTHCRLTIPNSVCILRKKFGPRHENASTEALPLRKKFAPRRENASTEALPLRKKFAPWREFLS